MKKPSFSGAIQSVQGRVAALDRRWRWGLLCLLCLLSGLAWAGLCRFIEVHSIHAALDSLLTRPFALTVLFFLLAVTTAVFLTHSLFAGNLLIGLPAVILSFINYFKVSLTSTPLTFSDLALAGQVGDIASLNKDALVLGRNGWLALLGALLWLAVTLLLAKPLRIRWRWSLAAAVPAGLAFFLAFWVWVDPLVYVPLEVDTDKVVPQFTVNDACGMPLGLWRSFYWQQQRLASMGKSYSEAYMESILQEVENYPQNTAEKKRPHIILLLSESFFDISKLEGVTYDEDPVADFHALQEESVSGTFYTRSLGYGTCNIEMEILTGLNTGLLSGEDLFGFDSTLLSQIPAVPYLLQKNGYSTGLVHMFNDAIYNRSLFFPALGFEEMYFSGDLGNIYEPLAGLSEADYWAWMENTISGGCYSDAFLTELLCTWYEKQAKKGPAFLYGISMENHGPHTTGKYQPEELTVNPHSSLTGEAAEGLLYASQGISNASKALGQLADYFRDCEEPVVIVFFGDHKPGLRLNDGGTVYSELGIAPASAADWSAGDYALLYSADYLIWSNDPDYLPGEPGSRRDTSCNYLGATLLDIASVEKPAYWRLISRLGEDRLIDTVGLHIGTDGVPSLTAPEEHTREMDLLTALLKDAVYGKQYVTGRLKPAS